MASASTLRDMAKTISSADKTVGGHSRHDDAKIDWSAGWPIGDDVIRGRTLARTQAADYDQRREAIVDRAAQLFASMGFRGASIADLAAACATSKSLIYHYYPSKEDILYAVMASHIDQLVTDVEDVMSRPGRPAVLLGMLLHAFMRHYVGAADRQKVLLNELKNLPDNYRAIIVIKQRIVVDAIQKLLIQIHPKIAADKVRARAHAMLLLGMINWTSTWFDPAGPISADEIADMALKRALAPL